MVGASAQGSLVGERFGKYQLLALLAVGGTAEIYLARIGGEAGFEKFVVIKRLLDHLAEDQDFVRMFLDEARLGAQLDHSNIVQTLELGEHHGRYYMVMEYLAGMSLSTLSKKAQQRVAGGLPIELSLCLVAQACAGLHYAHQRTAPDGRPLNVIHRDVSPQNLVVSFEGILKIVDFGIAKAALRETQTKSGTIKGKFAYMSPEQCLSHPIDRRTDIFALGTVVHELLTGQRLFRRVSSYETYQAIVTNQVIPPSAVNPYLDAALDAVVLRALAYDPVQRYPTAEAFGESLLLALHRRGQSVGAGDVARFFDAHFQEEIETHALRMRQLVTDGQATLEDITWHATDLNSDSASQMPDEPPESTQEISNVDEAWTDVETQAPTGVQDCADAAVMGVGVGRIGPPMDDGPTRVEPNPLLRVQTLHAQSERGHAVVADARVAQAPLPSIAPRGKSQQGGGRQTLLAFGAVGTDGGARGKQTSDEAPTVAGKSAAAEAGPVARARAARGPTPALSLPAELVQPPTQDFHAPPRSRPENVQALQAPPQTAPSAPQLAPPRAARQSGAPYDIAAPPASAFPLTQTPTPFRPHPPQPIADGGPAGPPPGSDLAALAAQRTATPPWGLALAFLAAAAVGLLGTLLVRSL
jgi:serine/threonine-protein kinase